MNKERSRIIEEDLARIEAMTEEDIDFSDIPEVTDEQWWSRAVRGKFHVPITERVSVGLDSGLAAGYQRNGTRLDATINTVLRKHIARRRPEPARQP